MRFCLVRKRRIRRRRRWGRREETEIRRGRRRMRGPTTQTCVQTYTQINVHDVHVHIHTKEIPCKHRGAHTYICMRTYTHAKTNKHMHIYIYTHLRTHTYDICKYLIMYVKVRMYRCNQEQKMSR